MNSMCSPLRPRFALATALALLLAACEGSSDSDDTKIEPTPDDGAATPAQSPPKAEPKPEPPPTGYALLPGGTPLRLMPDPQAPSIPLPELEGFAENGRLEGPPRSVMVMVTGVDGEFLAVETLPPPEGEQHCEDGPAATHHFRLRFFVPRDAPLTVSTRELVHEGVKGTKVTLAPGTPLHKDSSGTWVADAEGVRVSLPVPEDAVGRFYEPGPKPTLETLGSRLPISTLLYHDGVEVQGTVNLKGGEQPHVYDHSTDADGTLVTVASRCLTLVARSSAPPSPRSLTVRDPRIEALKSGTSAGILGMLAAPPPDEDVWGGLTGSAFVGGKQFEVRSGATIYWEDSRIAGQVVADHRWAKEGEAVGQRLCFSLPLDNKAAGAAPLTLCFDAKDVHEKESPMAAGAFGVGGLGLVGTGRGGGGTGEGTIGLGSTGLIGKGGGGGTGSGYGRGSGAGFGGRGKRVPRVRQAKATVRGALDKDIIRRIVRAHINEVRYCYNQGLVRDPALKGRVSISFTISAAGKVSASEVDRDTLSDDKVGKCIAKAVKRWKFPKPIGGGIVQVTYPFVLEPG